MITVQINPAVTAFLSERTVRRLKRAQRFEAECLKNAQECDKTADYCLRTGDYSTCEFMEDQADAWRWRAVDAWRQV